MNDLEKEKLLKIYNIVNIFKEFYQNEIQTEMNTIFMTDGYEGLETACGMIGDLIDNDALSRLMITNTDTRNTLQNAYQACEILEKNISSETEDLIEAFANLKACYYTILNFTYGGNKTAQDGMNNILEICEYGCDIVDMIDSKSEDELKEFYIDPFTTETIHSRIDQLRNAFTMLQPKYDPENTKEANNNNESNENNS